MAIVIGSYVKGETDVGRATDIDGDSVIVAWHSGARTEQDRDLLEEISREEYYHRTLSSGRSAAGPRFELGRLIATSRAMAATTPLQRGEFLHRHVSGDWGLLDAADVAATERALESGDRLLSIYCLDGGEHIYVMTEADRSATTLLLWDEY